MVIALTGVMLASPPVAAISRTTTTGLQAGSFFKTERPTVLPSQTTQSVVTAENSQAARQVALPASASRAVSVKGTTIYGIQRDGGKASIASFVISDNISVTQEKDLAGVGPDTWTTGCYNGTDYTVMGIQFGMMDAFFPYNKDNGWSTGTFANGVFYPSINAVELAYDQTTGTTYGVFANGSTFTLGTVDFPKQKNTTVASLDQKYITLSFNSAGQAYAISADGNLYTLDKTTGASTLVGATGVTPGTDPSSACFTPGSNVLLWIESKVLYTVDPASGAATKVTDVSGTWSGIFAEPGAAEATTTTVYGLQRYSGKASIASFVISDNISVTQEKDLSEGTGLTPDAWSTGCFDGTNFTAIGLQYGMMDAYYPYNKSNGWSMGPNNMFYPPINAVELAYDQTTGTTYGIFANGSAYKLGTVNFDKQQNATIADLDQKYITLSINSTGQAYAIAADGKLYTIDKTTGASALVGATGVTPGTDPSSACFTPGGDALLWIESQVLYSVDPATGTATKMADVAGTWSGIFVESSAAAAKVTPDWVDDMRVTFNKDALNGDVSFLMPTTASNAPLTGILAYHVEVDEEEVATGDANPGQEVTVPLTLTQGKHVFNVYASKDGNPGFPSMQTKYIGHDTPTAPQNLTVTEKEDGTIMLNWDPVTIGVEGGYVSAETMIYTVVRNPDNVKITETLQTTAVDQSLPSMGNYSYSVTPYDLVNTGATTESETMLLGQSIGIVPPYSFGFGAEGMGLFTQLNANNDEYQWSHDTGENLVWLPSNPNSATDDWLISPPIKLAEGNYYTLAVSLIASFYNERQQFEIRMGKTATPEGMSEVIYSTEQFSSSRDLTQRIQPHEAGEYYIGIHVTTPAVDGAIGITNFSISTGIHKDSPAACRITAVTPAEAGGKSATVSFSTPTATYSGNTLTSISKAVVKNMTTDRIVKEFVNPEKGASLTATDNEPALGNNRYSVVCYNEAGAGYPSERTVWVGPDIPSAPGNVSWQPANDGVTITWAAPTTGENRGYVDPSTFTYTIVNDVTEEVIAKDITELTTTYKPVLDGSTQQVALSFSVSASNEVGAGRSSKSNITAYGKAYDTPFAESFEGVNTHTSPWLMENEDCANYFMTTPEIQGLGVKPYDDDAMLIYGYFSQGITRMCLPIIDLSKLKSPVLKFYAYYLTSTTSLNVVASHDSGHTWQVIGRTVPNTTHNRWHMASVDLSSLKGEKEARIALQATSADYVATPAIPVPYVFIDQIRIEDYPSCDLKLTELTLPRTIQAGKTFNASVTAVNNGSTAINGYTVDFSVNGVVVKSVECPALQPSEFKDIEVELPLSPNAVGLAFVASANYEGDVVPDNNTLSGTTSVLLSRFPEPANLVNNSTQDGRIDLTWSAPATTYKATLTDDLESYEVGSIGGIDIAADINTGNIGDYTLIDNDKHETLIAAGLFGSGIPNLGKEMVCQVIDVSKINSESTIWSAHSGNKLFCFWTTGSAEAPNDDYLILPRLADDDARISFWAKSLTNKYGLESFDVMVSFTGTEIEDFTTFQTVTNVPAGYKTDPEGGYTFYDFELPEGTTYVAIHYNQADKLALLIDDITCTPADNEQSLTLVGYNVYRNDVMINKAPVTELKYTDVPNESADFRYNVTSVFAEGESRYSNSVNAKVVSGIGQVGTDMSCSIYTEGREIVVEVHADETVSVYTPDGRLITSVVATGRTRIPVSAGIYIVKVGNKAVSVAVR